MSQYRVTRKFTGGNLVGLTHTEITSVRFPQGFVCDSPVGGSPYVIVSCEEVSVADVIAERQAKAEQGNWLPACGGTETPFTSRSGIRMLYCWQPSTGRHAYINCDTDMIMTDEEARAALRTY